MEIGRKSGSWMVLVGVAMVAVLASSAVLSATSKECPDLKVQVLHRCKDHVEASVALRDQIGKRSENNVRYLQEAFSCLDRSRVPVLAAVQGGAIGAGVDLITACDMRYMTADAFLTIYEINIGMTADVGTFPRITNLLPEGIVKELAYTGRRMGAEEAKARGLINDIFPTQDDMLESVMNIAEQIASKAPLAIYGSKRMINYARDHSTEDALDYVRIWNASMLQQDEIQESMRAAKEQRSGDYVDLPSPHKRMANSIDE